MSKWIVEISDEIWSEMTADDLRFAINDAFGFPLAVEKNPDLLKVETYYHRNKGWFGSPEREAKK